MKILNLYTLTMLIVGVFLGGCREVANLPKIEKKLVQKKNNREVYRLNIKNNMNVSLYRTTPPSNSIELLFVFAHKKWGEILFENEKSSIDIEVPKNVSQKKLLSTIHVISQKGNSRKLLGLFKVYAFKDESPRFSFISYAFLSKKEREYFQLKAPREELVHAHDWLDSWNMCSGYLARKKDGSLWEFGEIGNCDGGEIYPTFPNKISRDIYTYYSNGKKIAEGFIDAKIINGGERFYAIKKDGTLWRGDNEDSILKEISKDRDWKDIGINIPIHDGLDYDIGVKKDGSLWEISPTAIKPLVKSKGWIKVLVECCDIYAQQKDKSIKHIHTYIDKDNKHVEEINSAKEHFTTESEYGEFLSKFSKVKKGEIKGANYALKGVKSKKDGTLWFPPKIEIESVEKNVPITVYSSSSVKK